MISFGFHFFFCNLLISVILGAVLLLRKLLEGYLSGRFRYRFWIFLPVILTVPFVSIRPAGFLRWIFRLLSIKAALLPAGNTISAPVTMDSPAAGWIRDLSISVARGPVSFAASVPFLLWIAGMLAMTVYLIRSRIRLYHLEQSALPLQNPKVRKLYDTCRAQIHIQRSIPIYSTAFLKTPIIVGIFCPRIYLPVHLIADHRSNDIRYMLLHELQHYKHKDALINYLINLAAILYWFNPVIWYALKEIRTDREVACDTYVLQMLDPDEYLDYGNTLLNFAQKLSQFPFSLAAGIGGNTGQIRKRILNIASYQPLTRRHRIRESLILTAIMILIWESAAWIPVSASDAKASLPKDAVTQTADLSDYFARLDGCFVLYDLSADTWEIYNESLATRRVSPDSTYKIYSALYALENGVITPDSSALKWDGRVWPFPEWNQDQTLTSAMQNSVNWYFQTLDQTADPDDLEAFYQMIDYGNQDLSGGISEFWMESSLKISALEQVKLLRKLYTNEFHLAESNIQAVKDALKLSDSNGITLSGKTGTGIINGNSINGWFIGYVESDSNTWFFAANVQGDDHADGLAASRIIQEVLAEKRLYYESP